MRVYFWRIGNSCVLDELTFGRLLIWPMKVAPTLKVKIPQEVLYNWPPGPESAYFTSLLFQAPRKTRRPPRCWSATRRTWCSRSSKRWRPQRLPPSRSGPTQESSWSGSGSSPGTSTRTRPSLKSPGGRLTSLGRLEALFLMLLNSLV